MAELDTYPKDPASVNVSLEAYMIADMISSLTVAITTLSGEITKLNENMQILQNKI